MKTFIDRAEAGCLLAKQLAAYVNRDDVIVLALPRGGVPIGYEIAKALNIPLDIFLVRKLGVPGQEELAMGAITLGGGMLLNENLISKAQIPEVAIENVLEEEARELARRNTLYRSNRPPPDLKDKIVIVADDGLATGITMLAAVAAIKAFKPKKIVVAVPVAALTTYQQLLKKVDEVICLQKPENLYAISTWYQNFSQLEDEEILRLLAISTKQCS